MNENKITLYFRDDNPESVFAYTILSQLGRRKSKVVTQLIFSLAEKYGVSDIQDLTLRQLAELKAQVLSDFGITEPTGKPAPDFSKSTRRRKTTKPQNSEKPIPASETDKIVSETAPEVAVASETVPETVVAAPEAAVVHYDPQISAIKTEPVEEAPAEEVQKVPVTHAPDAKEQIDDVDAESNDAEDEDDGYVNEDLLSQLGAFYGG